jgi:hypothetical protein
VPEPSALAAWSGRIGSGAAVLSEFLDEIVRAERFGAEIVPALVFGAFASVRNYYALPSAFVLKRPPEPGAPLYLRAPCALADAVAVRPWWDLGAEVRVCPDAYRPDKWTISAAEHSYRTTQVIACDSQVGSPEGETRSLCGCGPSLIRCLRDEDQYAELNRSLMAEVKRTTAYVVQHDLPMAFLFTGLSTFRDRNVELYYRRQQIGARELADPERLLAGLDAWPAEGRWAPRTEIAPGQHAGLLTAPQILHWLPDRRQRQRGYYEMMWCSLKNSFGATTHKVLELNASGNNFFAHDSWQRLAHTQLCTDCHARLDYGSRFFHGYPDSRASTHYIPSLQLPGEGPLYGRDSDDPRGTAQLTPLAFGRLATAQPEFSGCMTQQLTSYVLGDRATRADVEAIAAAVTSARTFNAAMRAALERYAAHWHASRARAPTPSLPAPGAVPRAERGAPAIARAAGPVQIGPDLRARIDLHCIDCHDAAPYSDAADTADLPFDLRGPALPRPLVVSMAEQVAFGMMPKHGLLDPREREAVVQLLVEALWDERAAREEASRYFLGRGRGLPAHQLDHALFAIARVARGASETAWGALERALWSEQATVTPGFVAVTGLEALRACQLHGSGGRGGLAACLDAALALEVLARRTPPPAAR